MGNVKPPELRAKDEDGNTRPADDRWLTEAQQVKRDRHIARVGLEADKEAAKAARVASAEPDPVADVLANAVDAIAEPVADFEPPALPPASEVTSPTPEAPAADDQQPALPADTDDKEKTSE